MSRISRAITGELRTRSCPLTERASRTEGVNAEAIVENFISTAHEQRRDAAIELRRTLLSDPLRLIEDLEVTSRRGSRLFQRRQRLYESKQVADQLKQAGFRIVEWRSSIPAGEFDPSTSPTMVVIAERVSG